jgi:hypothetical protein
MDNKAAQATIQCNFTKEELEYLNAVIVREQYLTEYVRKQLGGLGILGVALPYLVQPNIVGKLLSYLKKAQS